MRPVVPAPESQRKARELLLSLSPTTTPESLMA